MKKVLGEGAKVVTEKDIQKVLNTKDLSKSKKMLEMFNLGVEIKDISDIMTKAEGKLVRYNFVYNVVSNYCNMNGIKMNTTVKEGKKDQIIDMFKAGRTNKEISIDLKTNYNYVFNVIKQFKAEHPEYAQKSTAELSAPVTPEEAAQ